MSIYDIICLAQPRDGWLYSRKGVECMSLFEFIYLILTVILIYVTYKSTKK